MSQSCMVIVTYDGIGKGPAANAFSGIASMDEQGSVTLWNVLGRESK